MKFQAFIDGIHFDPKKGAVKIVLIGASHVSLDELTTLSPKDEPIQVTLKSEQTKLDATPLELDLRDPIIIGEEAAVKLKAAADRLKEGDVDGDEVEGGGQGGIL